MPLPPARRQRLTLLAALVLAAAAVMPANAATRPIDERPSPTPLLGYIIAIDPGHNGGNASHPELISHMVWVGNMWNHCNRTGTGTKAGYPEHRFNWLVSNLVKTRLEALGARVVMTRQSDHASTFARASAATPAPRSRYASTPTAPTPTSAASRS